MFKKKTTKKTNIDIKQQQKEYKQTRRVVASEELTGLTTEI